MNEETLVSIRGFTHLQIREQDGSLAGDSGYKQNQITDEGVRDYLARLLGAIASSKQVSHMALGTGGAPASNATSLTGEVEVRKSVTAATNGSTSVRFTATFGSSDSFVTNTQNISNVGLFETSTAGGGTLFAGNAFASSSVATNQQVEATYDITFTRP